MSPNNIDRYCSVLISGSTSGPDKTWWATIFLARSFASLWLSFAAETNKYSSSPTLPMLISTCFGALTFVLKNNAVPSKAVMKANGFNFNSSLAALIKLSIKEGAKYAIRISNAIMAPNKPNFHKEDFMSLLFIRLFGILKPSAIPIIHTTVSHDVHVITAAIARSEIAVNLTSFHFQIPKLWLINSESLGFNLFHFSTFSTLLSAFPTNICFISGIKPIHIPIPEITAKPKECAKKARLEIDNAPMPISMPLAKRLPIIDSAAIDIPRIAIPMPSVIKIMFTGWPNKYTKTKAPAAIPAFLKNPFPKTPNKTAMAIVPSTGSDAILPIAWSLHSPKLVKTLLDVASSDHFLTIIISSLTSFASLRCFTLWFTAWAMTNPLKLRVAS